MASKPKHPHRGPKSDRREDKGPPRQPPKPATTQRRPGNAKSAPGRNSRPPDSEQEGQSPLHHASSSHNGSSGFKGAPPKCKPSKQENPFHTKARGPQRKPQKNVGNKDRSWELRLHTLNRSDIIALSQLKRNELVTRLYNSLKTFQQTLQRQEILATPGIMDALLQIVLSLTEMVQCQLQNSSEASQQAGQILAEILSSRCDAFHFQLKQFVINLNIHTTVHQLSSNAFGFEKLCQVFETLLKTLPSSSWSCLPVDELFETVKQLSTSSIDSAKLVTKSQEIVELRNQMAQQFIPKQHKSLVQDYPEWDNSEYRQICILPKWEDICISGAPAKLRPNIVDGAYTDWMHYYDIQFRLLREDFIAPLRRGVCEYMQGIRGWKLKDVKVYHNVRIVKPVFTFAGTCFSLRFDVSHLRHYNWIHSKRLIFGSLVCLSPDEFQHDITFATVANREPRLLAQGIVEVLFEEGARILPFSQKDTYFTMVESNAYFEASCHILRSLQTAEVETMPFTRYLIQNECTSISPPQYLADHADSAHYDLTCLYGSQRSSVFQDQQSAPIGLRDLKLASVFSLSRHSPINILERSQWPDHGKLELDQSQLDAIQMALTQEIAVIQGPPGTGKTYIGLKIVEALLNNRQRWDREEKSPIVVMCFTNHALDQFLEGILKAHVLHTPQRRYYSRRLAGIDTHMRAKIHTNASAPKIVRIGGRSQSDLIKPLNISIVKKSVFLPREVRNQLRGLKDLIRRSNSSILWRKLSQCHGSHSFPPLNDLYQWIDPDHYYQLLYQAQSPEEWDYALEIWLGLMEVIEILPAKLEANISAQEEQENTSTAHTVQLPEVAPIMVMLAQVGPEQQNQILRDYLHEQVKALHLDFADEITDNLLKDKDVLHMLEVPELLKMKAQEIATVLQKQQKELIDVQGEAEVEEDSRMLEHEQEDFKELNLNTSNETSETIGFLTSKLDENGAEVHVKDMNEVKFTSEEELKQPSYVVQPVHNKQHILQRGRRELPMTDTQASAIKNIHNLSRIDRWRLYNLWVAKHKEDLLDTNETELQRYNQLCREHKEASQQADRYALETADVIGMTTTGAAKYQHILHLVKPKIVIVEEAAEVLESHIVSALNAGSQHLILIGDHKQLRPKPNEYDLVKKYKLDISLFERLVLKGFPHATLQIQHRMRPEIAELVCPHIYDTLINHESVLHYGNVKGICQNLFFIHHEFHEKEDQGLLSHSNPHEASYIPGLCKYLLQQGYEPSQITVLVTYTGQLMMMRKQMLKEDFDGIKVTTVDNYQGEENDIILLSLVRSNEAGIIGFLREANRVCVSLSRAKMGFYCIGNFKMLRDKADIWERIVAHVETKGCLGDALPLCCFNHPETKSVAKLPVDFAKNAPLGGCTRNCEFRLQCGHVCERKCHIKDPTHEEYKCTKPCAKRCSEGHPCKLQCHVKCRPCNVRVERQMPECGHMQKMFCHQKPSELSCKHPCPRHCPRGHPCPFRCSDPCEPCTVPVLQIIPGCLHEQEVPCHLNPELFNCMADCPKKCKNGHPCRSRCHQPCGKCSIKVNKTVYECGHTVSLACHINPEPRLCSKPCERKLPCGHIKIVECRQSLDLKVLKCEKPCEKNLPCQHPCKNLCCEPCTEKCEIEVHNRVWPCGHKFRKRKCYQAKHPEKYPCQKACEKELQCGHKCTNKCGDICTEKCSVLVERRYPCGHINKVPCHSSSKSYPCRFKCSASTFLSCGHKCAGECPDCYITRIHKPCTYAIKMSRFCGHTVPVQCLSLEDIHPDKLQCSANCTHSKCSHSCSTDCPPCIQPCEWTCPHHQCTKLCHEMCDRPPCNERCQQRLTCGHQCFGICGEPCLDICPDCQTGKFKKCLKQAKNFRRNELYVQLGCGHIFTVEFMDTFIYQKQTLDVLVGPKKCPDPQCDHWISSSFRYGNAVKQSLHDVASVRKEVKSLQQKEILDMDALQISFDTVISKHMTVVQHQPTLRKRLCARPNDPAWIFRNSPQYNPLPQFSKAIVAIRSTLAGVNSQQHCLVRILIAANEFLSTADTYNLHDVPLAELSNSIKNQLKTFIKVLVLLIQQPEWKGKLTVQVLEDLKSEQYRLALLLKYCAVKMVETKPSSTQGFPNKASRRSKSIFSAIQEQTEKLLHTLEANHFLRMTHTDYETHSVLLNTRHKAACGRSIPFTLKLVDQFPPLVKGQWYKCSRGHYYCTPPARVTSGECKCPQCF